MLAVAYAGGLRAGEIGRLRVDHLEWHDDCGVFALRLERAKHARRAARVVLDEDSSRLLGAWLPLRAERWSSDVAFPSPTGRALSRRDVARIFAARLAESGIDRHGRHLTPHSLRHSLATHLLDAGWDIRAVQAHLRHASIATTQEYLHLDPAKVTRYWRRRHPLRAGSRRAGMPSAKALLEEMVGTR